ncbi:MAG: GAF domain-containing protein, partial [Anaerolineae bacterium]
PSGDLVFHVALGPTAGALVGKRISKDASSLSAEALKRGEPIIVNDTAQDSRWHGEVVKQEDEDEMTFHSRAILTTPLISQGSPIGVLQILNKKDRSIFTEEDAQLLTTFAAQAAVAIQNAKLFESQDAQLLQRVEELDRMAAIDQQLNKTLELYKVAEITLNWAIQHAEAKVGALAVVKPDSNMMRMAAVRNYPMGSLFFEGVGNEFSIEEGIWGRVIRSATPVFSRSLKTDPDYIETYPDAVSQIVVPIISANEAIGIILLESDNETDLNLLDLQFLSRLADHASPAIANAQLFDQLRHQQEARAEFVSFIAHELKAPMTSMKGYTDLLMRGVVGPINDQQGDFL